jgi:hypothetical protein
MARSTIIQLVAGVALGGIFLWVLGQYGWESPRTVWAAIAVVLIVLAVNLGELRTRLASLEKSAGAGE